MLRFDLVDGLENVARAYHLFPIAGEAALMGDADTTQYYLVEQGDGRAWVVTADLAGIPLLSSESVVGAADFLYQVVALGFDVLAMNLDGPQAGNWWADIFQQMTQLHTAATRHSPDEDATQQVMERFELAVAQAREAFQAWTAAR